MVYASACRQFLVSAEPSTDYISLQEQSIHKYLQYSVRSLKLVLLLGYYGLWV